MYGRLIPFCGLLGLLATASPANAVSVVLRAPEGTAAQSDLERVQKLLLSALHAENARVLIMNLDSRRFGGKALTAHDLHTLGERQNAHFVLSSRLQPCRDGHCLQLTSVYILARRIEVVEIYMPDFPSPQWMQNLLRLVLRPEGITQTPLRLSSLRPSDPNGQALDRDEPVAFEPTAQSTLPPDMPWRASAGLSLNRLVIYGDDPGIRGGWIGGMQLRIGHVIGPVHGMELRAGFDLLGLDVSGIGLMAGIAYQRPIAGLDLAMGGGLELGAFHNISGSRTTSFMMRGGPVLAWRLAPNWSLEASVVDVLFFSRNMGVLALGAGLRLTKRF